MVRRRFRIFLRSQFLWVSVLGIAWMLATTASRPAFACQVGGNLVSNCGFTSGIAEWTVIAGSCSPDVSDGSSAVGNINCSGVISGFEESVSIRRCISPISASTVYAFGFDLRVVAASPTAPQCQMTWTTTDAAACGGTPLDTAGTGYFGVVAGPYTQSPSTSFNSGPSAAAVNLTIQCTAPNGSPYTVRFDDVFLGIGLTPVELQSVSVE